MLKTSNMQPATIGNRFILGIVAFGVSFGLSLVLHWDFNKAFLTGIITIPATYLAVLFIDKRRRNHEMLILDSLHKRIKEMEGLKSRLLAEINQLDIHHASLYKESSQLQNQIVERRNQRESLSRELSSIIVEKKQLEGQVIYLQNEIHNLEKTKVETNNTLNAEKRRLELNCNVTKAEINQLQNQLCELQQQKQELESNLTLLERLKPQLEEKLYEMRVKIQELEAEGKRQDQILTEKKAETKKIEYNFNCLQEQITEKQGILKQLQEQVSLLQDERDHLQSQVWELLQHIETLNPENISENEHDKNADLFPFADLLETIEEEDTTDNLLPEWTEFLEQIPNHEMQVLKAILEQENPNPTIKKLAEANITMPNLLIDSINERANDTLGELIIDPSSAIPEIYPEHANNLKRAIAIYEDAIARQTSSN
ncbi:MAG: hypothetical protein N2235_01645 [Fischerella sp.]|nr:hypothetical protein [Fischerella sp.]